MNNLRTGLSYGDVLLVPNRSPVDSRSDVDLSTQLTPSIELETPLVSAAMDTVTEAELAIELSRTGSIGVLHRFLTPEQQANQVEDVAAAGEQVAAAVGINEDYVARSAGLVEAGVDALVVDVAHGHLERTIEAVETLRAEFPETDLIAGNVATPEGVDGSRGGWRGLCKGRNRSRFALHDAEGGRCGRAAADRRGRLRGRCRGSRGNHLRGRRHPHVG